MAFGVRIRPDFDGDVAPPSNDHALLIAVAVVITIAVLGAMLWLLLDIRSRVQQLELRVASMEVATPGPATGPLG